MIVQVHATPIIKLHLDYMIVFASFISRCCSIQIPKSGNILRTSVSYFLTIIIIIIYCDN